MNMRFQMIMVNTLQLAHEVDQKKTMNQMITISIPKTWDFTKCGTQRKTTYRKSLLSADIEIRGEQQSLDSNIRPWSVQHQGCGEKCLAVKVPEQFFIETDMLEHHRKGGQYSIILL